MIFLSRMVKFMVNTPDIRCIGSLKSLYTRRYINCLIINYSYETSHKCVNVSYDNDIIKYDISYGSNNNINIYSNYLGIWSHVTLSYLNKEIGIEENVYNYESLIKVALYVKNKTTIVYDKPCYKTKTKYRLYYQNIGYLNIVY